MRGVAFAVYLKERHGDKLKKLSGKAHTKFDEKKEGYVMRQNPEGRGYYGLYTYYNNGRVEKVRIDGACGFECVIEIAKAIGVSITKMTDVNDDVRIWSVSWYE